MSRLHEVWIGLKIFKEYGGTDFGVEHDQIWSGQAKEQPLNKDDIDTLFEAGWFQDSEFCECDHGVRKGRLWRKDLRFREYDASHI